MPYVTNDGVQIYYEVEGFGPPLVLHIGFLGTLDDWRREDTRYTAALRDRWKIILLDPRGIGRSDKPHEPEAYNLATRVGDVVAVLDDLQIYRAHYWGYSLGGSVGMNLALRAPERLISLIAGGTNPYLDWVPEDKTEISIYQWLLAGMPGFVESWERELGLLPSTMRDQLLLEESEALAAALLAVEREEDIDGDLTDIQVPTLFYEGTDDDLEPVGRAARLMPNATVVPLEGLDHVQAFRRSDLVLPHVIEFLRQVDASSSVTQ